MPAIEAVDLGEEARRGADNLRAREIERFDALAQHRRRTFSLGAGALLGWQPEDNPHQASERWIAEFLAVGDFALVEAFVIVLGGGGNDVMLRLVGLQNHLPAQQPTSRAPRHLSQQLERALVGAEI